MKCVLVMLSIFCALAYGQNFTCLDEGLTSPTIVCKDAFEVS